jgi:hypothetical protein
MTELDSDSALRELQSHSRYYFGTVEFAKLTGREPGSSSTKSALARLSQSGKIVSVSRQPSGWVIVPPEHSHYGAPPVGWWLHDCLRQFEPHYYLALLSAARHWGSSHYALQDTQVMLSAPRQPLSIGKIRVTFFPRRKPEQHL